MVICTCGQEVGIKAYPAHLVAVHRLGKEWAKALTLVVHRCIIEGRCPACPGNQWRPRVR